MEAIRPKSVIGEMGQHTRIPSFQREPRKWLVTSWEDVEDWFTAIITFEDTSKAVVFASDGILGGVRKWMEVYLSNAVVFANINPNNALQVYAPDPNILKDEYITEKLETKAGWNFASPDEDWMGGYPQELEDFIDCFLEGREPVSGLDLAEDAVKSSMLPMWRRRRSEGRLAVNRYSRADRLEPKQVSLAHRRTRLLGSRPGPASECRGLSGALKPRRCSKVG
jgi:hypothetical protein